MRRLLLSLALLVGPAAAMERYSNQCRVNSGAVSANCIVRVFVSGTLNNASLFSDNGVTPLANPFTAASNGQFFFYAADGVYDIQITGGSPTMGTFNIGAASLGAAASGVTSWNTRTGAVVPASGDYTAALVTNAFDKSTNNALGAFYVDITQIAAPANPAAGTRRLFVNTATGQLSILTSAGSIVSLEAVATGFAPASATYIVQTANASLTNAQALGALGTGIVKNTTITGVLSIASGADLPSHNHTESQITDLGNSVAVPQTRTLLATSPVTIAGAGSADLTVNRTIACATCEVTGNKNGVNGYAGLDGSARLAAAQFPALIGDVTTAGGSLSTTLANSGVVAGTYPKLTVNAKGLVTAGTTLASGDIPSHSHAATDITSGILLLARGGTGSNLSATGGAKQFLKQTTAGGNVSVAVIVQSDITEVIALADLTDVTAKQGNSTTVQMFSGAVPTTNDCAKFDVNGNIVTNGAPCANQAHAILSSQHSDTTPAAVLRGDVITGQGAGPVTWARLALGATGTYHRSNGTDLVYSAIAAAGAGSCPANQWVIAGNDNAVPTCAQPGFGNLSGAIALSQTQLTTRGDLWTVNSTPALARLALGSANLYPKSNGSDLVYSTLAAAGVGGCTNQFARTLNADAAPTCATVANADLANSSVTVTAGSLLSDGGSVSLGSSVTLNAYARQSTFCSGTATSSTTLFVTIWAAGACTNATESVAQQWLVSSAGKLRNLRVLAGTAGFAAGSGAVTLRVNGVDSTVTCTVGTGTTCNDTTHTAAVVAGDKVTVKLVTQATETLADVQVAFEL